MKFDAIILGAGINGCGIARALSSNGKKVLIIEKGTVGSGTSSKTSKLVHGGLRYLENLEISLVKEALHDRGRLCKLYPHLVQMRPFYIPIYADSHRPPRIIRLGLRFYDFLAGRDRAYSSGKISIHDFVGKFPELKVEDLKMVLRYYDAVTDDLLLTREVAADAKEKGAVIWENTTIDSIDISETRVEITIDDLTVTAPILINAVGPWISEVIDRYGLQSRYTITKVSGVHLVIGKKLVAEPLFLQTGTERIFFMIPYKNATTLIGTSERIEARHCDMITIDEADIVYLIDNANKYLRVPIEKTDIVDRFIGVRPLIESKDAVSKISREYRFDFHRIGSSKILHVFGGKLTTFLTLAERAVRILEA